VHLVSIDPAPPRLTTRTRDAPPAVRVSAREDQGALSVPVASVLGAGAAPEVPERRRRSGSAEEVQCEGGRDEGSRCAGGRDEGGRDEGARSR